MDPSGKSKGPPPAVKKVLSLFGSGREEDRMTGYLSFLKIGPKLLRFLPGEYMFYVRMAISMLCMYRVRLLRCLLNQRGQHSHMCPPAPYLPRMLQARRRETYATG